MRVEASCGGGKWVAYSTFLSDKQGLMVFKGVAEALLDNSGMLREPRKVGRQKNVVMVVVGCGQVRT